ncbi:MAG TPA: hypothetical protein VGM95_00010 [Lactobacillaceae bacterium]|jgi:hypothetical protein
MNKQQDWLVEFEAKNGRKPSIEEFTQAKALNFEASSRAQVRKRAHKPLLYIGIVAGVLLLTGVGYVAWGVYQAHQVANKVKKTGDDVSTAAKAAADSVRKEGSKAIDELSGTDDDASADDSASSEAVEFDESNASALINTAFTVLENYASGLEMSDLSDTFTKDSHFYSDIVAVIDQNTKYAKNRAADNIYFNDIKVTSVDKNDEGYNISFQMTWDFSYNSGTDYDTSGDMLQTYDWSAQAKKEDGRWKLGDLGKSTLIDTQDNVN